MNKYYLELLKKKAADLSIDLKTIIMDEIQAVFLEEFYKVSISNGAVLFGGGRFRHINNSIRFSVDLDFFEDKGFNYENVLSFIKSNFTNLLRKNLGIFSRIIDSPPWEEAHNIKTVRLLIHDEDFGQIILDFDFIERQPFLPPDKSLFRNVVILAGNARESLEEKLISIYERQNLKVRDIFDFWYYRDLAMDLDRENIQKKLAQRGISLESVKKRLNDFLIYEDYHIKEIKNIIKSCGENRDEVKNLLQLDMAVILNHLVKMTQKYILDKI